MATNKQPVSLIGKLRQFYRENEWLYFVVGLMVGLLLWPLVFVWLSPVAIPEFLTNLVPEAVGITFTVLIINRLDAVRENRLIRERLTRQMHSYYNPTALQAVEELRLLGYLSDGTLHGVDLRGADLRSANLYQADLRGANLKNTKLENADLYEANLEGATITDEQLAWTWTMRGATMPDGTRYDGRFNLPHDKELCDKWGHTWGDPASMAQYYGVSEEKFLEGQRWAEENLARLRAKKPVVPMPPLSF